jgi:hypothetical protein
MKVSRLVPGVVVVSAAVLLAACSKGPSKQELVVANTVRSDSITQLRNELLEQVMEGSRFVNEINKELAKARSLQISAKQLETKAELTDVNEERKQAVARIQTLVTRLDQVQSRLSNARNLLAEKDSSLSKKISEYEVMVAEINQSAEKQRLEFQAVIDTQTVRIAALTGKVDTLTGTVGSLVTERNTAYYVIGTRQELLAKGVLVAEGPKRFGFVGSRAIAPARELDPSHFTKINRLSDSTIVLPDGEYKILSRQSTTYATPAVAKNGGKIAGSLKIEQPERFWSASRYLIIVRS